MRCPNCHHEWKNGNGGRRPTLEKAQIEELYAKGWSTKEIADHFGVSRWGVRKVVLKRRKADAMP